MRILHATLARPIVKKCLKGAAATVAVVGLINLLATSDLRAGELDQLPGELPLGVIVRQDSAGKAEVFKSTGAIPVSTDEVAAQEVQASVIDANKVQNVLPLGELDQVSSDEAWYYGSYPSYGYSRTYYSCNYRSVSYYYYPSYVYYTPRYTYTYYSYCSSYSSYYGYSYYHGCHC